MPVWKLTAIDPHAGDFNADFEKAFGFVIRADTEDRARQIATEYGGCECGFVELDHHGRIGGDPWLEASQTRCECIAEDGPAEVILRSASTDQPQAPVDSRERLRRSR